MAIIRGSTGEAEEFKTLMKLAGWNGAETAERLHVSEGLISGYLSGSKNPPLSKLALMRRLVDEAITEHSPSELHDAHALKNEPPPYRMAPLDTPFLEQSLKHHIDMLPTVRDDQREMTLGNIQNIAAELRRRSQEK